MVIQGNMSPDAIAHVWNMTVDVFKRHHIGMTKTRLDELLDGQQLNSLLVELNSVVGSTSSTCSEGG